MNHLCKRSFSMIMAILMVLSLIPANPVHVHAEDATQWVGFEVTSDSVSYSYASLGSIAAGFYTIDKTSKVAIGFNPGGYANFTIKEGTRNQLLADNNKVTVQLEVLKDYAAYFQFKYVDQDSNVKTLTTPQYTLPGADDSIIAVYELSDAGFNGTINGTGEAFGIAPTAKATYIRSLKITKGHCPHVWKSTDCANVAKSCTECGITEYKLSGHAYQAKPAQAPTCTEKGWFNHYYCSVCDKYFALDAEKNPGEEVAEAKVFRAALGHNYEGAEWVEGETTHWKVCTREGCEVKGEEDSHSYTYDAEGKGTCVCGKTTTCEQHKLEWDNNTSYHWQKCEKCGYTSATAEHETDYTYDASGHWLYCTICKADAKKTTFHTHSNVKYEKIDENTHKGTCPTCEYSRNEGHTWDKGETVEPTYETEGYTNYSCKCGATKTDDITPVIPAPTEVKVSTKAELDAALSAAQDGDTIVLTADIQSDEVLKIEKAITLDLGGFKLTTTNGWGGLQLKNGCSVKNGTLLHTGRVNAIKAWDVASLEDLVIEVTDTTEDKTVGGISIQENAAGIDSIKNVTLKGVGLDYGIETYNCGNAQVIGTMENVNIDAVGTGMLLSAPCGTATNCTIKGGETGINMLLKGTYSVSLKLVDCDVEGGKQAVYAHDEQKGYTYVGSLSLTADSETTFESTGGVLLTEQTEEATKITLPSVLVDGAVAKVNGAYYKSFKAAVEAANAIEGGATVTLLDNVTLGEKLTISGNVTISGAYTITRADTYTGTLFEVAAGATLTLDGGLVIDGNNNYTFNQNLYDADLEAMVSIPKTDAEKYFTPEAGKPVAAAYMIVLTKGTSADAFGGTVNLNNVTIQNNYSINSGIVNAAQYTETNLNGAKITHVAATQASGVVVRASGAGIKVNMTEGTVIDGNHVGGNHGIFMIYSGTVFTMNGGEVKNTTGWNSNGTVVGLYGGTFVMNGGTICSNSAVYGPSNGRNAAIYLHSNSVMEMNGGTICHNTGRSRGGIDSSKNSSKLTITGGKVLDNISLAGNSTADIGGTTGTWEITGGTFTQDVSAWLAPDSGLVYDETTGTYGVTKDIWEMHLVDANGEAHWLSPMSSDSLAEILRLNKIWYDSLQGTYSFTLKLLCDVKIDETGIVDFPMTIDLNGKTITVSKEMNATPAFRILSDVTVKNGTVDATAGTSTYAFIVGNAETAGTLNIADGTYKGSVSAVSITKGIANISGGYFEATEYEGAHEFTLNCIDANYKAGIAKIVVNGGTFYKFNPANNAAEGAGTSFVADGYMAEADGDYYSVRVNKDALAPIVTITFTDSNTNSEVTLKYPSERFDTIQKLLGTNDYADFVLGATQSELLAYIADGRASNIVITLHDDIELNAPINFYNKYFQVPMEYAITLNGNDHTITWADGYTGTLFNVESGVSVEMKNLTIDGDNEFTFYDDTTTVENGQNWYTRFVNVGDEDKAVNADVIVNAGNLTLNKVQIKNVTIASTGDNGKTANTETGGFYLMYNDDLALIKSNGGKVTMERTSIIGNAGMILNAINAETVIGNSAIDGNMGCGNKGGIIIVSGGTMELNSASICGNKAMARSATVLGVISGAEVTMNGNTRIDNNKHIGVGSNTAGSIVCLEGASRFVMNGGSISNNVGGRAGAIASRWVGGNYGQHEDTSIVLNAGTIAGNTASNDSWNGASIFLRSPATIGEGMKVDGTIAVNAAPGELDITGGTFTNFNLIVTDGLPAEITGGTFNADPSEWLADGYVAPKNADGTYTARAQSYVEWVQEQLFAGYSVTLTEDIVITDYDLVHAHAWPSNGNGKYDERHGNGAIFHVIKPGVVLDLNGHSITWDAHDADYCNARQVSLFMVTITGNAGETASLTVKDSVGTGKVDVYGMGTGMYVVGVDATGTIEGGTWTNYPCKTCDASNIFIYPSHGGKLVITGGTFEQKESEYLIGWNGSSEETSNNGVGVDQDATEVVISGGTFVGFNPNTDVKFIDTANGSAVSDVNGCDDGYEAADNGDGTYGVIPTKLAKVEVEMIPGFWGTSYITVENWADLLAALGENTSLPVKVTLLADIELTDEVLTISGAAKKVIDLNGHKITGTVTAETTTLVYVTGGCELTLLDSSDAKTGGIHAVNTNGLLSNLIRVETDATLVIESGNYSQDASVNGAGMIDSRGDEIITVKGGNFRLYNIGTASNGSPWIFNASSQNEKNIIVNGGTFNADVIHQFYPFEVMAPKELALVEGDDGIWSFVPAVAYVNEQEWSSAWYTNEVGYATLEDAIAAVEEIRTKNDQDSAEEFVTLLTDIELTAPVDTNGIKIVQGSCAIVLADKAATLTAPAGLTVTTNVTNRKVVYQDGVYKLAVLEYVAQIGETKYESLQAAINDADPGDTIVVLKNINIADVELNTLGGKYNTYFVVAGKTVIINLNGKIISGEYTGSSMLVGVFSTENNGHLTLTGNGTIDITATGTVYSLLANYDATSTMTVENGTYKLDKASDSLIYSGGDEKVTIKGGTFTLGNVGTGSNGSPWIFNAKGQNTANIIVNGGTFNADVIHQFYPFEVMAPKELALVEGDDGIWSFVPAVAYVNEQEWSSAWYTNEVGYATLEAAIAAVEEIRTKNGQNSAEEFVTLLTDVQLTAPVDAAGIKIVQGSYAIVLADKAATLTAAEGLNVTTNVADCEVEHKDGKYIVVDVVRVAQIGDTQYKTLAEAIDKAQPGDTIVFLTGIVEDVTVNKNLTIDGASFKYTGTMTVNAAVNVTVEKVKFVNGGVDKTTKSATGTYTFKNCTFDGEGQYTYAFRFKGANKVIIEDCSIKNYRYSFLYVASGTNSVSVKNVTVENCPSYAVYFASGVNAATFENLTVKNSNNGFVINNTANRAFTIKNCTMENVSTAINHANGTNTITCTVLGVNDFGTAGSSEYAKYMLAETDATLTAPENANVTTSLEGYTVKYVDGTYKVVKMVAQNATTGEIFGSIQEAIDKAQTGETVVLLDNITLTDADVVKNSNGHNVMIKVGGKAITLNLNEKTITVDYDGEQLVSAVCVEDGASLIVTGNGGIDIQADDNVFYLFWKRGTTGTLIVKNGTYHMNESKEAMVYTNGHEIVTIEGGTWTLDNLDDENGPWIFNTQGQGDKHIVVTGGTFNADINRQKWSSEVLVSENCYTVKNTDGTWTVNEGAVAYVTTGMTTGPYFAPKDIGYATIEEAIKAAVDYKDENITLLQNVALTKDVEISIPGIILNAGNYKLDCGDHKIILTAADATLKAPKDLNVVSDNEAYYVDYVEGTYKLVQYVAQIVKADNTNGGYYATVNAALAVAQSGDTVKMLANDAAQSTLILEGITLDLNGFAYTSSYMVVFNGGNVVDNSETNAGRLVVDANKLMINEKNAQLPVKTETGYMFVEIIKCNVAVLEEGAKFAFQPWIELTGHEQIKAGTEKSGVSLVVRVTYYVNGAKRVQDFVYSDALVEGLLNSWNGTKYTSQLSLKLNGLTDYSDITYECVIVSETGVELSYSAK